jgi:MFS family permease
VLEKTKIDLSSPKINRVLTLLTLSDIFTWGFYIMANSLAGIYLAKKIDGRPETYVGLGLAISLFTQALTQVPLGILTDRFKKDVDEIAFLAFGNVLMGISYFSYPLITAPSIYFFLQLIFGLGASLNLVSWRKLFAQNLSQNKEGLAYATYGSIMSLFAALFSIIAGLIAGLSIQSFDLVMRGTGTLMMLSSLFVLSISLIKERSSLPSK